MDKLKTDIETTETNKVSNPSLTLNHLLHGDSHFEYETVLGCLEVSKLQGVFCLTFMEPHSVKKDGSPELFEKTAYTINSGVLGFAEIVDCDGDHKEYVTPKSIDELVGIFSKYREIQEMDKVIGNEVIGCQVDAVGDRVDGSLNKILIGEVEQAFGDGVVVDSWEQVDECQGETFYKLTISHDSRMPKDKWGIGDSLGASFDSFSSVLGLVECVYFVDGKKTPIHQLPRFYLGQHFSITQEVVCHFGGALFDGLKDKIEEVQTDSRFVLEKVQPRPIDKENPDQRVYDMLWSGITCGGCRNSVKHHVLSIPGVESIHISSGGRSGTQPAVLVLNVEGK